MALPTNEEWGLAFLRQAEIDFAAAEAFRQQNYVDRSIQERLADDKDAAMAIAVLLYLQALEKALKAALAPEVAGINDLKRHNSLDLILAHGASNVSGSGSDLKSTVVKAFNRPDADGVERVRELQGLTPGPHQTGEPSNAAGPVPTYKNTEYPWFDVASNEILLPHSAITLADLRDAQRYARRAKNLAHQWLGPPAAPKPTKGRRKR